jgi:methyl-galactoside transport system ATP-binding protein
MRKNFPGVQALDGAKLKLRRGTIHALIGENGAGKSTLMKCLFGIYKPDEGEILYGGKQVIFENPKKALEHGISMVHQELNQVLTRNVLENIWMGRLPMKGPFALIVDEREMYRRTEKIFDEMNLHINPWAKLGTLSVSERQMVEIARAVSYNARVLVMDEPTSSLTEKEVAHLFSIFGILKDKDCGIIYISHKMEEILQIADDITVMRDGKWIATHPARSSSLDKLIFLMVGRSLINRFPPKPERDSSSRPVLLSVRKLSGRYPPSIVDVSFDLREGEILGVGGLMGSRRTEMVETLFGLRTRGSGEIRLRGKVVRNNTPRNAIHNKFALITEERRKDGVFPMASVRFNSVITQLKELRGRFGFLDEEKIARNTNWVIEKLKVKTPSQNTKIKDLSGGNQQKVIIGRWLLNSPDVLLLDEPTRGIDIGAKYEIYQLILQLSQEGKSIIFVSSEMPELLGMSDRILVMSGGRVAGIVDAKSAVQEDILRLAAKYL